MHENAARSCSLQVWEGKKEAFASAPGSAPASSSQRESLWLGDS